MDEILKKYQDQLDLAIKLVNKINRQKSYLVDLLIKDTSQASGVIINKYLDWLEEDEKAKPEPKEKEYYDEDTFDVKYLHVYNHITQGKTCMSPTLMKETYGHWIYMGKVKVEK
jgi:hypothetical protein